MAVNRIVVVGCGSIGQRHARLLARRPGIRIELCDTNADCVAEAITTIGERKCFNGFSDVVESRPDAVVIATPHAQHADQVIEALKAGIHVLCEKPMSDTLEDARRMEDAARRSPCILDFGFTLHFHPGLNRLKDIIVSGELGNIVHINCHVGTYATLTSSRTQHQSGLKGALLFDYVHQPDVIYWLTKVEPTGVYMSAALAGELPLRSNPNVADILLDYDVSLRASIHLNYVQAPQRHEYEVAGDRGWAILDMEANLLRIGHRDDAKVITEQFEVVRDQLFVAEHQTFLDAVEKRRAPESPVETAIVSMRVVDAAMRSWQSGTRQLVRC